MSMEHEKGLKPSTNIFKCLFLNNKYYFFMTDGKDIETKKKVFKEITESP